MQRIVLLLILFALACKPAHRSQLDYASFTDQEQMYFVYYEQPTFYLQTCKATEELKGLMDKDARAMRDQCRDSMTPITLAGMSEAIRRQLSDISLEELMSSKSKRSDLIHKQLGELSKNAGSMQKEMDSIYAGVPDDDPAKKALTEALQETDRSIAKLKEEQKELKIALDAAKQEARASILRDLDVQDTLRLAGQITESATDHAQAFTKMLMSEEATYRLDPLRNRILRNAILSFSAACVKGGEKFDSKQLDQGLERIIYSCSEDGFARTIEVQCPLEGYERLNDFCIFTGKGLELSDLAASHSGLCAVSRGQGTTCWGKTGFFPVNQPILAPLPLRPGKGLGSPAEAPALVPVPIAFVKARSIVASDFSMCSLDVLGKINRCWPNVLDAPLDKQSFGIVLGGYAHYCGINSAKTVECWGQNDYGQSAVPPGLEDVKALSLGDQSSCALRADGAVFCWGQYLGLKVQETAKVPENLGKALAISSGAMHSCAILEDQTVRCWGQNDYGQLNVPTDLAKVSIIQAARYETCAVTIDGALRCWGTDTSGAPYKRPPALLDVKRLKTGVLGSNTCAIYAEGKVACWGSQFYTGLYSVEPPDDLGPVNDLAITAVGYICAKLEGGSIRCWGNTEEVPAKIPDVFADKS